MSRDEEGPPNARGPMPFAIQAATIREMLATLDTLTSAGQRHSMSKIVDFAAGHARRAPHRVGPRNGKALAELNEWLQRESERTLPDIATFRRHTENLLTLLAAIA